MKVSKNNGELINHYQIRKYLFEQFCQPPTTNSLTLTHIYINYHFLGCRYQPNVESLINNWPKPVSLQQLITISNDNYNPNLITNTLPLHDSNNISPPLFLSNNDQSSPKDHFDLITNTLPLHDSNNISPPLFLSNNDQSSPKDHFDLITNILPLLDSNNISPPLFLSNNDQSSPKDHSNHSLPDSPSSIKSNNKKDPESESETKHEVLDSESLVFLNQYSQKFGSQLQYLVEKSQDNKEFIVSVIWDDQCIGVGSHQKQRFAKRIAARIALNDPIITSHPLYTPITQLKSLLTVDVTKESLIAPDISSPSPSHSLNLPVKLFPIGFYLLMKAGWDGNSPINQRHTIYPHEIHYNITKAGIGHKLRTISLLDDNLLNRKLIEFLDKDDISLTFDSNLTKSERIHVHDLARMFNLNNKSVSRKGHRFLIVSKKPNQLHHQSTYSIDNDNKYDSDNNLENLNQSSKNQKHSKYVSIPPPHSYHSHYHPHLHNNRFHHKHQSHYKKSYKGYDRYS